MKSKDNDKNFRFGAKYDDIRERIIENRREQSFPKTMKRQLIAICSVIVIFSLSIGFTLSWKSMITKNDTSETETQKNKESENIENLETEEEKKALIRGIFLGSGSINDPTKKYHLEILSKNKDVAQYIQNILKSFNIKAKILEMNNTIYIKEGEEISKFLAFIGAQKAVLKYEEIRVMREIRNNVNRQVNCETANLNKTISASVMQIEAINYLKEVKKYEELPTGLQEIAELRLEYPEMSLKDLGSLLEKPLGKSGVNHRLKKIIEIADEAKKENA